MKSGFIAKALPNLSYFDLAKVESIFYYGNTNLLESNALKVAIVGTRHPNKYTQQQTANLAKAISNNGGIVVSGGALGVDIIAHKNALPNTILISPVSIEYIYPAFNKDTIKQIGENGLILSEYENKSAPTRYDFLDRNRLIVALSDIVIIPQADIKSGSMNSAKHAKNYKKPLYVLPHRLNESSGTQELLAKNEAYAIYDIDKFLDTIGLESSLDSVCDDEILEFCKNSPSFESVFSKFGEIIYEYELMGKIKRVNGCAVVC